MQTEIEPRRQIFSRLAIGALAGFIASGPMGLLMTFLHRFLPPEEKYHLPPREIIVELAERTGVEDRLNHPEQKRTLTWIGHFAYGTAVGSLYPLMERRIQLPPVPKGMFFGLLVWMISYLGWLPTSGILPSAANEPVRRNALMVVSHLFWGSIVGWIINRLE